MSSDDKSGFTSMPKKRNLKFSVVKAVKNNARLRLGMPPPAFTIPDAEHKAAYGRTKHKPSLADTLHAAREELK